MNARRGLPPNCWRRADVTRPSSNDTIAAIATAPGRSAVALIRISGPRAREIASACIAPWPVAPRRATLVTVRRPDTGEVVDQAIATLFPSPHSFTGEDVVELSPHGGTVSPVRVLAALARAGARAAEPGEFTRRALFAGKLDLLQAEALADLIDAPTTFVHRAAVAQMSGAMTSCIAALRDALIDLEALLAYDIDFPEEDEGPLARGRITAAGEQVRDDIARLLSTLPAARLGREGAIVVLAGAPNTGKSSLFNALLGEARAIVTEHAGTTRDAIDTLIEAEPFPWRLVDTAGLRDTNDPIERIGVEFSARWLSRADVVLLCGPTARTREVALAALPAHTACVVPVHTMSDQHGDPAVGALAVSAATGEGLDDLRLAITNAIASAHPPSPVNAPIVLRARHEAALDVAHSEVTQFLSHWSARSLPPTVAAVHVRAAIHALDELIGAVGVDDVLGRVFERFCVGK